ncbi:MAG: glycosyltransferase family 2 protein [Phycisphaerales bacterium]|nr:glycosyltransferase family 2 protein [Phycisphaerales bacterium]
MSSIAIIIPAYNNRDTLAGAVESALAEQLASLVVVVDDGSIDGGAETLDVSNSRLRIRHQENSGPSAARNHGIDVALSAPEITHIFFLDADDALVPDGLPTLLEGLERVRAVAAVGGRWHVRSAKPDDAELRTPPEEWAGRVLPEAGLVFSPAPFFTASGILIRRHPLDHGLRFDPGLRIGEDRDFLFRAAEHGGIYVHREAVFRYMIHESGQNLTGHAHIRRWLEDHLTLVRRYAHRSDAAGPLQRQTSWLIGHGSRILAKQGRTLDPHLWRAYRQIFEENGWIFPLRAMKWRHLLAPLYRLRGARPPGSDA